ncbi:MAG: F0F1 ATP synthase subunit A [Planctomycetota bacterium]|nr:F0F1 ATP synthase subunit A [Planctomycetota bacterium]
MSFFRPLVMLAIVAGSCFLAYNFSEHHKVATEVGEDGVEAPVNTSDIFTTLYFHVVPAPVIAGHGHADHGHDGEAHGDDHGHAGHHAAPPLVAIPLPLPAIFDGDKTQEGTQLVLYNLQIFQLAALLMILVAMSGVPSYLRTGKGDVVTRFMGGFCQWLRDDLVEPAMGKELSAKLLPLMMYVFFFILFMNVMGLTPMSVTPTACIFVTGALALITFVMMIAGGMIAQGPVNFLKHLVPDVPLFLWPMLFVIELLGLLIKPVALMIRLFATMTGGHLVVLSFLGLIFFFGYAFNPTLGKVLSPVWVGFAVFIMIIEAFVAMIQAYIFTLLSSLFISASVHPEH